MRAFDAVPTTSLQVDSMELLESADSDMAEGFSDPASSSPSSSASSVKHKAAKNDRQFKPALDPSVVGCRCLRY